MQKSWTDIEASIKNMWNTELWTAGEAQIHLSQVIIALALIVVGIIAVRWVGHRLVKRALLSSHASQNTVFAFRKLFSFIAYVMIILVALPVAGIPITIFAVLGGALAIGVGFGAQNLLNNLISGMILIAERPIRIGDIVELENERGRIEEIGNRCVRIKRFDGVHVLVPNSYFLEQRVVNWTLVSSEIRSIVTVGVAHGSPVETVRELMLQAAHNHDKIVQDLPIEVLFEDFDEGRLIFSLLFWTNVEVPMDIRRVQSDIRFAIDTLFSDNQIVIAFQQHDVHLDTSKPLHVKMK